MRPVPSPHPRTCFPRYEPLLFSFQTFFFVASCANVALRCSVDQPCVCYVSVVSLFSSDFHCLWIRIFVCNGKNRNLSFKSDSLILKVTHKVVSAFLPCTHCQLFFDFTFIKPVTPTCDLQETRTGKNTEMRKETQNQINKFAMACLSKRLTFECYLFKSTVLKYTTVDTEVVPSTFTAPLPKMKLCWNLKVHKQMDCLR